jgi:hypothetical protein
MRDTWFCGITHVSETRHGVPSLSPSELRQHQQREQQKQQQIPFRNDRKKGDGKTWAMVLIQVQMLPYEEKQWLRLN